MKTLSNYIKKSVGNSQNGHFEEFVDEEIADITTMWVDNDPEEIVKAVKEATPEELQKLKELRKASDKLDDELWSLRDELSDAKDELRSLKDELHELQYGMEDEIGRATTDEERDELGNEYGEQIEEVQNKIKEAIENIEKLAKQKEDLEEKALIASNKLFEYEEQLGYYD